MKDAFMAPWFDVGWLLRFKDGELEALYQQRSRLVHPLWLDRVSVLVLLAALSIGTAALYICGCVRCCHQAALLYGLLVLPHCLAMSAIACFRVELWQRVRPLMLLAFAVAHCTAGSYWTIGVADALTHVKLAASGVCFAGHASWLLFSPVGQPWLLVPLALRWSWPRDTLLLVLLATISTAYLPSTCTSDAGMNTSGASTYLATVAQGSLQLRFLSTRLLPFKATLNNDANALPALMVFTLLTSGWLVGSCCAYCAEAWQRYKFIRLETRAMPSRLKGEWVVRSIVAILMAVSFVPVFFDSVMIYERNYISKPFGSVAVVATYLAVEVFVKGWLVNVIDSATQLLLSAPFVRSSSNRDTSSKASDDSAGSLMSSVAATSKSSGESMGSLSPSAAGTSQDTAIQRQGPSSSLLPSAAGTSQDTAIQRQGPEDRHT